MQLEEPQGEAKAVPPEVDAADVEEDRIDAVGVGSEHGCLFTSPYHVRRRQGSGHVTNVPPPEWTGAALSGRSLRCPLTCLERRSSRLAV